jgi:hypothetical protein
MPVVPNPERGRNKEPFIFTIKYFHYNAHLRQKSIISSGPASACAPAASALHTDIQCLPVSGLLIISTLATAKPKAEADLKHFDNNRAFHSIHHDSTISIYGFNGAAWWPSTF